MLGKAILLRDLGELENSLKVLDNLITLHPNFLQAYVLKSNILIQLTNFNDKFETQGTKLKFKNINIEGIHSFLSWYYSHSSIFV